MTQRIKSASSEHRMRSAARALLRSRLGKRASKRRGKRRTKAATIADSLLFAASNDGTEFLFAVAWSASSDASAPRCSEP